MAKTRATSEHLLAQRAEARRRALEAELRDLRRLEASIRAPEKLMVYSRLVAPHPEAPDDVTRSTYEPEAFHDHIATILERLAKGELKHADGRVARQVLFSMPPRHGKTQLGTKNYTAWLSGRHPEWDIAVGSYSDAMAEDFGSDIRAILQSAPHKQAFPKYALARGGESKTNIVTNRRGRLVFVGRGGALTGRGANVAIIDDPIKDAEEAASETIRNKCWEWFTKVVMTRRMDPKIVIVTMTRWHSDDIIGRLTDPKNPHYDPLEARNWMVIRIPALAEENDPLGRAPGEPLWPERYDREFMAQQQRLDPLGFAALYQQRPTVADGVMFRRESVQRYKAADLPENLRFYCTSDHAVGTKQRNDPSVFIKFGVDPQHNIWLIDLLRMRMTSDVQVENMLRMGSGNMKPLFWWAEKGHISMSIGPFLRQRMNETRQFINVVEITPTADKQTRAQSFAAMFAMGKVFLPQGAVWDAYIEELMEFPNGTNDDQVDASSLIGLGLESLHGGRPPKEAEAEPEFGTLAWLKRQDTLARRAGQRHEATRW